MVTTQLDAEQMLESAAVEYPDLFERPDGISKDKSFIKTLQALRQTDNLTNWYYLVRTWVYLTLVLAAGVAFDLYRANMGWSIWWNVPVGLVVITLVGAGQHQLTGLAHEASHYTLLANRRWNDLVSDWLCMYPMFSSTHHYRLQHMAHHQFVNDPDRDPDVSQLKSSGHWLKFPMPKWTFARTLVRQLWIPNLIRYIRIRAQYNAVGTDKNPYAKKGVPRSKVPFLTAMLFIALLAGGLTLCVMYGNLLTVFGFSAAVWCAMAVTFMTMPADKFLAYRIQPIYPPKVMTVLRMTYFTLLFTSLAVGTLLTGQWWAVYFLAFWVVPMFTSFSFFMILRQLVQHGNADRGWLSNTRVFFVNPFINFAVFPIGQEFHLPHHMFASIPHYRLRGLHEAMMRYPSYRDQAVVVEGYFFPKHRPPVAPTVIDLAESNLTQKHDVYIDNEVIKSADVVEVEAISAEAEKSRQQGN